MNSPNGHMLRSRGRGSASRRKKFPSRAKYIRMADAYSTADVRTQRRISEFVITNMEPLVRKNAIAFLRNWPMADEGELVQAGRLGILKALEKWDGQKAAAAGAGFMTYASFWIFSAMQTFCKGEMRGPITVPKDVTHRQVYHRLDEPVGRDDDSATLEEVMSLPEDEPDLLSPDALTLRRLVDEVLDDRERDVVWRMMGEDTLENVGQSYGLTRERIRQIKGRALVKLGKAIRRRHPELVPDDLAKDLSHPQEK